MAKLRLIRRAGSVFIFICCFGAVANNVAGQNKTDTVTIDGSNLNMKALEPSTNRYLVYFKNGKDAPRTGMQIWTREIAFTELQGKPVIQITQAWEDKDSIFHQVTSYCDSKTMAPRYHKSWWKQYPGSEFDFMAGTGSIGGQPLSDADTARRRKAAWEAFKKAKESFVLNWHLDLEVFPLLPFKAGRTFLVPFYDPGSQAPVQVAYTVTGSAQLTGYDNRQVDCWLLSHVSGDNKEIFWISKVTKEVLKLEQQFGKDAWRYKIKLGFSN